MLIMIVVHTVDLSHIGSSAGLLSLDQSCMQMHDRLENSKSYYNSNLIQAIILLNIVCVCTKSQQRVNPDVRVWSQLLY